MDDIISPKMRIEIEDIIGEALVKMSRKEQVQMLYLAKEYEQKSQELFVLIFLIKIWSNDKQKPEERTPEQSNNSDHLSVHGPSTNTGRCTLKEKLKGLAISVDSPLIKIILEMAHQFVQCLEKLSIRKCEAEKLE